MGHARKAKGPFLWSVLPQLALTGMSIFGVSVALDTKGAGDKLLSVAATSHQLAREHRLQIFEIQNNSIPLTDEVNSSFKEAQTAVIELDNIADESEEKGLAAQRVALVTITFSASLLGSFLNRFITWLIDSREIDPVKAERTSEKIAKATGISERTVRRTAEKILKSHRL